MKKVLYAIVCGMFFIVFNAIGSIAAERAVTESASGFWMSDLTQGIAVSGMAMLSNQGYSITVYRDASVQTFYNRLANDDIILIHTHGDEGCFWLSENTIVSGNMVESSNVNATARLVYLSACEAGNNSTDFGNVGSQLYRRGVQTVVTFKGLLSASTNSDGIHRFNSLVMSNFIGGETIYNSIDASLEQIYTETGEYHGANTYFIYGNPSLRFN